MAAASRSLFQGESYAKQRLCWPLKGKHILAQFDEDSIIVYMAFKPSIADYAVEHQRLGGDFSFERMSWIKTNFLWMMYRCGWGMKKNQERVLAITISRVGFEEILANAYTREFQKANGMARRSKVRLQWDPDHYPNYDPCYRKAVQLGIRGPILQKYNTEFIQHIEDISDFVHEQKKILDKDKKHGEDHIQVAKETVYTVADEKLAAQIELDHFVPRQPVEPDEPVP